MTHTQSYGNKNHWYIKKDTGLNVCLHKISTFPNAAESRERKAGL